MCCGPHTLTSCMKPVGPLGDLGRAPIGPFVDWGLGPMGPWGLRGPSGTWVLKLKNNNQESRVFDLHF